MTRRISKATLTSIWNNYDVYFTIAAAISMMTLILYSHQKFKEPLSVKYVVQKVDVKLIEELSKSQKIVEGNLVTEEK